MSTILEGNRSGCRLAVKAPHWTSQISVRNHLFEEVGRSRGILNAQVLPGIYEVEATLGLEKERQLIAVRAERTAFIGTGSWKLQYRSAAPLRGAATTLVSHAEGAQQWSRDITLKSYMEGDSRLFVFARALDPEKRLAEDNGLRLLGRSGEILADFTTGVRTDLERSCLALTCDLPPGPYMLHTKRPFRYQPLWLCPGYETHVFIPVSEEFSLGQMSVSMSRKGEGFDPSNEDVIAAELIWQQLQQKLDLQSVDYSYWSELVAAATRNPWFCILAAHAAHSHLDFSREKLSILLRVLQAVHPQLLDHPDVRGLILIDDEPAGRSFDFPPMLWRSLKLAQKHATLYYETIPLGSLTDNVLDSLVLDSPWSAWRSIDYYEPFERDEASYNKLLEEADKNPDDIPLYLTRQRAHQDRAIMQLAQSLPLSDEQPEVLYLPEKGLDETLANIETDEISRECGITLGRAREAVSFLLKHPALIMQSEILSPSTQAAASYVSDIHLNAENSSNEQASNDFSLEGLGQRLRLAAAEFTRLSSISDRLAAGFQLDLETIKLFLSSLNEFITQSFRSLWAKETRFFAQQFEGLSAVGETIPARNVLMNIPARNFMARILRLLMSEWSSRLTVAANMVNLFDSGILITDEAGRVRSNNSTLRYFMSGSVNEIDEDYFQKLADLLRQGSSEQMKLLFPFVPESITSHLKITVKQSPREDVLAFLYILRTRFYRRFDRQALQQLEHLTSSIALHETLIEYGAPEQRLAYLLAAGRDINLILRALE